MQVRRCSGVRRKPRQCGRRIAAGLSVSDSPKFIRKPKEFLDDVMARNAAFLGEHGNVIAVSAGGDGMEALRNRTQQLESQVRAVKEKN